LENNVAKINLLKTKWVGKRQIERLNLLASVIIFLTVGGFLLQSFYVAGRLVYLRSKIARTKNEIQVVNNVFKNDKTSVENFVWAQGVLEKIAREKEVEYKYKKYLLEINSWLTSGTSLAGVSFTKKDEISFIVFADNIDYYRGFETNLKLKQEEENFGFRVVEQESLSRTEDGTYKVKIRLKI